MFYSAKMMTLTSRNISNIIKFNNFFLFVGLFINKYIISPISRYCLFISSFNLIYLIILLADIFDNFESLFLERSKKSSRFCIYLLQSQKINDKCDYISSCQAVIYYSGDIFNIVWSISYYELLFIIYYHGLLSELRF